MSQMALLFESLQHGANRGLLQWARQGLLDEVGAAGGVLPDEVEDFAFEIAQVGDVVWHSRYSV